MENTYSFLKNAWLRAKEEVKNNPIFLVLLVLLSLPLPYKYNSISVIVLAFFSFYFFKKENLHFTKSFVFLVAIYALMVLSLLWTLDLKMSVKALSKTLPFVVIPLIFSLTPKTNQETKNKILNGFAYGFFVYALGCLTRAVVRYFITQTPTVFFYHELVSFDVNAIHVSVYMSVAFFTFLIKENKKSIDKIALVVLFIMIVLLSSKNIIILFFLLFFAYVFFQSKWKITIKKVLLILPILFICVFAFYGKIKNRFLIEIESNKTEKTINNEISGPQGLVYNVSVKDAWTKDQFQHNDYFPGLALRVYQARIFKEMISEDNSYLTGYGINATDERIAQKRVEHNLYPEYEKFNFHNQYIQFFAELGLFGFLFLLILVLINLKNAINSKDFVHFSFAILMISLFLTESFLARQRGVVFFVTLYCLFNSVGVQKDK
ncbi:MAG: O-antigen ligase family protein [Flavobacterium sp.]|nr:O-antigen ligase family protein [Flavobacterium sp.]